MTKEADEVEKISGDKAFIELFERLSEDEKAETVKLLLKIVLCNLTGLPGIVLLYDGDYMHIHGISVNTTEAKEMLIELAAAFEAEKALKNLPQGVKH